MQPTRPAIRTFLTRGRKTGSASPGEASSRLSGKAVALVVKRAAERAGLNASAYAGHSLRAGFVTTAAANGASERAIARQTGHCAGSTVLRQYIRHASAFTDNAVSMVGL